MWGIWRMGEWGMGKWGKRTYVASRLVRSATVPLLLLGLQMLCAQRASEGRAVVFARELRWARGACCRERGGVWDQGPVVICFDLRRAGRGWGSRRRAVAVAVLGHDGGHVACVDAVALLAGRRHVAGEGGVLAE